MDITSVKTDGIEPSKQQNLKKAEENGKGISFKETLGEFVNDVNNMQNKADQAIEDFATGKVKNMHEVMISMKKAEMSFQFLMETRNKLVEAYKEVTRMHV